MSTLYLLGGPPRTAKTTIMSVLIAKKNIPFIPADAVEAGLRNVLTSKPHQMLRNIEFSGWAEYKASLTEGGERKPLAVKATESELTQQAILGMLDYYGSTATSVAFEGAAFSPAWAASLKLTNFTLRAAFVGYTNSSHASSVIAHAKENPQDWINEWLQNEHGDETKIREWVEKQVDMCLNLKSEAELHGYPFFDISTQSFSDYISLVQSYFLQT